MPTGNASYLPTRSQINVFSTTGAASSGVRFLRAVHELRQAGLAQLVQLGHTLSAWSSEIVAMWRFTRNNGITEGFHNKMELINRQAYGFRNFENYRLRVKVLCG